MSSILNAAAIGKEEHLIPGPTASAGLTQDPSSNALNENYSYAQAVLEESGLVARLEKDPSGRQMAAIKEKMVQAAAASVMLRQPQQSRSQSEMNENTLTLPEASPFKLNGAAQQSNQLNE